MNVCGQNFSDSIIERINQIVNNEDISRRELSRRVCDWLDWRSPSGKLQDMSCRKALAQLNRNGILTLPELKQSFGFEKPRENIEVDNIAEIECTLEELGPISVEPVDSQESKTWFSLMDQFHYIGASSLCGAQIRYIVKSQVHGYLGALAFSSGCWALKARDDFIGWSEAARRTNLQQVVGNDRFLLLPTVKVKNLASYVLGEALRRLADDWMQRYCNRPVLVETFVDPRFFKGTCYIAANWIEIGKTSGRRDGIAKDIFIYPLCQQFKEILCREPQYTLGQNPRPESPANWAENEFGAINLYDERLKKRLYTVAQDFYSTPQASIPEACSNKAKTIGAYRLFNNDKVTMDVILTAHAEATIERIKKHPVVLVPQDTTTLNYVAHPDTEGLGPINNNDNTSVGLILHDTLAFTEQGTPLGVLDAQCWARDQKIKGKGHRRDDLPIEQKESMKWLRSYRRVAEAQKLCPETQLICMGDREADIFDLFVEKVKDQAGPELLVRLEKSRKRSTEEGKLWPVMAEKPEAGSMKIQLPRRNKIPGRDALLKIRYSQVELQPPKNSCHKPIKVWIVYLLEENPPQTVKRPVEWMLLSTLEVNNFEDAVKRAEWYSGRWGIEVYHRTLKSGCRIKDRQLGTADRLETCLGVDMVVAWRIYHLTMLGRETPDAPCSKFFKDIEWKALCIYANRDANPPQQPPTISEAVNLLGQIGGHLGRKGDGPPGCQILWRALIRLDAAVTMYATLTSQEPPPNEYDHLIRAGP
jgi:hypothetical protein